MGDWDLKFGRGHFETCIRPFKKNQKWMQMIPNTISDTFQPIIDFSYGLDVEIRPKSGGAHRAPPMLVSEDTAPALTIT